MTKRIFLECGAAETRAALVAGDDPVYFWFGPARGDEALPRAAQFGEAFLGRVVAVSKPLHGAFIDIGDARDAFLALRARAKSPAEGAAVAVRVRRPALGAKGALVDAIDRAAPDGASPPVRLDARLDAALAAAGALGAPDLPLAVSSPEAAAALRAARGDGGGPIEIVEDPFANHEIDAAIASALERERSLAGGGRLVFDETEAMTVVDVDAGEAAGRGPGKLNDRVNRAAAAVLFPELARRGAGGRIVVDFLPPSSAERRQELLAILKKARMDVFEGRIGRLSADGIFDMTAPRRHPTLLEYAAEPVGGAGWVRAGRRLTLDWRAKAAMRSLERSLRRSRSVRMRLLAVPALVRYIEAKPQWASRLQARFGARFEILADEKPGERGFDVA